MPPPPPESLCLLARATIDGRPLSMEALPEYLRVFVAGGNDTLTSSLANG